MNNHLHLREVIRKNISTNPCLAGNPPLVPSDIRYSQMDQRETSDCALQWPNVRYPPGYQYFAGRCGRPPQSSILGGRCKCFPPFTLAHGRDVRATDELGQPLKESLEYVMSPEGRFYRLQRWSSRLSGQRVCTGGILCGDYDITERLLDRVGTARGLYTIRCCMEHDVSKRMEGSGRQKKYDELQNVWESFCSVCS